jgi:hypothetical protein
MVRTAALIVLTLTLPRLAAAEDVVEPKTGVAFPATANDMSLLGVGLRTKTFLKVKVYAIGFYVADKALKGDLAGHKADLGTEAFYKDLLEGDFPKEIVMKFVRDLSADQIQGAFKEVLSGADPARVSSFVAYFGPTKSGEEYRLHWSSATTLETSVAGQRRAPIIDQAFATAVLAIWLGPKPVQDDIKSGLVSRASGLIR